MINSSFSLKGKTILITGASSGLGACAAIECSKAGAKLIITGRNEERLASTYKLLHGLGHIKFSLDLSVKENIEELSNNLASIDGLVLCAGITKTIPVKFISSEKIDEIFKTNTISSMLLIQKMLKTKKINKNGSIVFISSISTEYADIGNSIYAASKGALNSFSKVLALELATKKITSNCIQPGFVPTRMLEKGSVTAEQLEEERKRYPLGFGDPTDIANGIIYLLSDAAKWVTGSILTIDGGVTLR
jgi:NAD(P)-dependent dehydrogenase (short-subunit alcohol dehydrogenase family)|tara:strand:+ start:506 stop:1249 length:744 start_codon:yes stop_codon:yes gene_type:complete